MNDSTVNIPVGLELTENPHFRDGSAETLYNSPCYVATAGSNNFNRVSEWPSAVLSRFSENLLCSNIFLPSQRTSIL